MDVGKIGIGEVYFRLRAIQGHSVDCNLKLLDRTLYQGKYAFHGTSYAAAQAICGGEGIKVVHKSRRIETFSSASDPWNWSENARGEETPAYKFDCEVFIEVNTQIAPFTLTTSNAILTSYHVPTIYIEKAYWVKCHDVFYTRPPAMEVAFQRAIGNYQPIGHALPVQVAASGSQELHVSSSWSTSSAAAMYYGLEEPDTSLE